jgi:hypothetical protein
MKATANISILSFVIAAAAFLFCCNNANATIYTLTATGTADGSDPASLFGGDLFLGNNPNFTATFTFDSSLNTLDTTSCAPGCAFLVGETSVTVTIYDASASYSYTTSATGPGNAITIKDNLHLGAGQDSLQGNLYANGGLTQIFVLLGSGTTDFVPSLSLDQSIYYVGPPGTNKLEAFSFTAAGDSFTGITNTIALSSTPLPSTWTMLIAGFVGLGFFAYRGTKNRSAAIAVA